MKRGCLVVFIVLMCFCFCKKTENPAGAVAPATSIHVTAAIVQAAPVFRGDLIERITTTGLSRANRCLSIRPRISGIIETISLQEGEMVKKGQTLFQLESQMFKIALEEARADYLKASIEYGIMQGERKNSIGALVLAGQTSYLDVNEAETQLARVTQEIKNGKASEEDLLRAKAEYEAAKLFANPNKEPLIAFQSGLSRAHYQFLKAQQEFENCAAKAPFDGLVGDIRVQVGDPVSPVQECFKLLDLSRVIVEVGVLETQANFVRPGRAACVTFTALPIQKFMGHVKTVSPLVNRTSRTCKLEILIDNPGLSLKDGMYATAQIDAHIHNDLFLAPKDAVLERDNRKLVFIVRDGLAKWCYVETGRENEEYVEILQSKFDLKEGESVITKGHFTLVHDAPVQVQN